MYGIGIIMTGILVYTFNLFGKYRTLANKGRAYYSKILVLALKLSHKKRIKFVF